MNALLMDGVTESRVGEIQERKEAEKEGRGEGIRARGGGEWRPAAKINWKKKSERGNEAGERKEEKMRTITKGNKR